MLEYCGRLEQLYEEQPRLKEDLSVPWQNVVILSYFGKREEAYEILRSHLCWEEDPLGATDIIELYPHILDILLSGRRRRLRRRYWSHSAAI